MPPKRAPDPSGFTKAQRRIGAERERMLDQQAAAVQTETRARDASPDRAAGRRSTKLPPLDDGAEPRGRKYEYPPGLKVYGAEQPQTPPPPVRPSRILSLCTRSTRAGIEWERLPP